MSKPALPLTAMDLYAERNPPRILKAAQQRGGSIPTPTYGLWEDRVRPYETRKNAAKRKTKTKHRNTQ
jgi:hypothetical protein